MPNKININQVEPESTVMLGGELVFSRLVSKVEGEELAKRNEWAQAVGAPTQDRPYTTISLKNVEIIPKAEDGTLNLAEQYIRGTLYKSQNPEKTGWNFSINDKSRNLPALAKLDENGNFVQFYPERDLQPGQKVYVVVRIYGTRMSNGKAIDAVMVDSTNPELYSPAGNRLENTLADYGITFKPVANPEGNGEIPAGTPAHAEAVAETRTFTAPQTPSADEYDSEPYVDEAELIEEDVPVATRPGIRFQR